MKTITALILLLAMTVTASASWDFSPEQRRAMQDRSCITNAPDAWKVGAAAREAWIASCRREAQ